MVRASQISRGIWWQTDYYYRLIISISDQRQYGVILDMPWSSARQLRRIRIKLHADDSVARSLPHQRILVAQALLLITLVLIYPLVCNQIHCQYRALKGVKNYKFYGYSVVVEIARAIVAASSFPNELRCYIERSSHKVNDLTTSDVQELLDVWRDLKQNVHWFALGNEPTLTCNTIKLLKI